MRVRDTTTGLFVAVPWVRPIHAPGTPEAIAHGCDCREVAGLFGLEWVTRGCPLHDPATAAKLDGKAPF